ncbi:MAG: hypothetical protein KC800_26090 [Candidatus Eremiobacteraeota bacterium]|nr:hypothetical protein [Candidatus Eremiobacteraeota bacterium]
MTASSRNSGLKTLPQRFLIAYTFLFMLPFPLDLAGMFYLIPGFGSSIFADGLQAVIGLHGRLTAPLVQAIGAYLTGQSLSMEATGSGDGLASYFDVILDATVALFVALAWWAWRRATPVSLKVRDVNRIFLRYYLFTNMVGYGMVKLIPGGQFPAPGPDRLVQPYGESSPMGLLWTFMGASFGYQMFTGAAEVAGGLLLLFRRTTLLGSLLVAAAMTNVFVLNLCYDVPVKLFSLHLMFFALILAAPDAGRLFALFFSHKSIPARDSEAPWTLSPRLKRTLITLKLVFVSLFIYQYIENGLALLEQGREAGAHPLRGIYRVESLGAEDPTSQDEGQNWVMIGITPPHSLTVVGANGSAERLRLRLDMDKSEMAFYERGGKEPEENSLRFEQNGDQLLIEGEFREKKITLRLKRENRDGLLTTRGFHWVNEVPFNR